MLISITGGYDPGSTKLSYLFLTHNKTIKSSIEILYNGVGFLKLRAAKLEVICQFDNHSLSGQGLCYLAIYI